MSIRVPRILACAGWLVLLAGVSGASPPNPTVTARSEDPAIRSLRDELRGLKNYVKMLEDRLERQERTAPLAAAAPPPLPPLPPPSLPAASPGPSTSAGDPLAELERELSGAKAMGTPSSGRVVWNPQISVVGDFVYQNSSLDDDPATPDASGAPTGDRNRDRFSFRELELAFQSNIDPYSRLDVFLELPGVLEEFEDSAAEANEPRIAIEEAFISYWRLPVRLQAKAGKFRLEFGKNNLEHNDSQHATFRPLAIRHTLGEEGISEQGIGLQRQFALGSTSTILELTGQLMNGEGGEESLFAGPGSDKTMGLGRIRFYHDFSDSLNLDLGHSFLNGHHDPQGRFRQRIRGYDLTLRYEPAEQMLYRQFLLRAEYLESERKLDNELDELDTEGFYLLAFYQWDRNWSAGYRYDNSQPTLQIVEDLGARTSSALDRLRANTLWLTYAHTEFNRWRLTYSRSDSNFDLVGNKRGEDLIAFQWLFSVGPHGAHRY